MANELVVREELSVNELKQTAHLDRILDRFEAALAAQ